MVTYVLQSEEEYSFTEYLDKNGKSPYSEWFQKLDSHAAAKVTVALLRLVQGKHSNVKWFKGIGEFKIDYGINARF
jgi:putative component of toxin-antitoxin plasmid stabilization module